jgi:hypothetical protein
MFMVSYDDARTAYMWVDDHSKGDDDCIVIQIALTQQEQCVLPEGTITSIRRFR